MSDITTGTELDGSLGTITRTNGDISAGVAMSGAITPPPSISGEATTSLSLSGELTSQLSSDGSVTIGNEVEGQIIGGPKGDKGDTGPQGDPGVVQAVVAGSGISVDNSDPANPIVTNTKAWGNITGTLSNQTDLQSALDNKVDTVPGKGLSENDYTTTEKNKLAGIASGAEVNVNADWSSGSGDSQILNKPTLATVATSGSYTDLSNQPSIPAAQVNSDWNSVSGVSKILNKPTIPTKTSDITNDSGFITSAGAPVQSVNSKTGTVSLTTADISDSTNKRYITDAQQTVLGNTSNTNTGDQDLSGLVPKTTTVNSKALSANITLNIDDVAPTQTGNSGKVLKTDGTNATWQTDAGGIASVVAGNNIDVDNSDPLNPVVAVENLTLTDITDITATATEVNYIDGVTSAVQTQINAKANDSDTVHKTGAETIAGSKTFTDDTTKVGKLFQINAPTGNPEFNFQENGTTRSKTYYDITNNRLVFQNNENNNQDAIYFTDHLTSTGNGTYAGYVSVADEAYGAGWNGSTQVPTKNAIYDKIEALGPSVTNDQLQDQELTATYAYVGYENTADNSWYIYRRTRATNLRQYATGATDYATNWTGRAGLTYV